MKTFRVGQRKLKGIGQDRITKVDVIPVESIIEGDLTLLEDLVLYTDRGYVRLDAHEVALIRIAFKEYDRRVLKQIALAGKRDRRQSRQNRRKPNK